MCETQSLKTVQQERYALQEFIKDVDGVVREYSSESEILLHLKPALERLVSSPSSVPAKAFTPRKNRFAMNLIQMPEDEAYSIIGGVWHPGQTTPIHDHLTWAMIGVYEGEEREALFRRTDDGSNPKRAKIHQVSERVHKKGHVTVLGHSGIHRVDNISLKPTSAYTSTAAISGTLNATATIHLRAKSADSSQDTVMFYMIQRNSNQLTP